MKTLVRILLAVLISGLPQMAMACPRVAVIKQAVVVTKAVVVEPALIATFVPVLATFTVGAGYALPPQAAPVAHAAPAAADPCANLRSEVAELRKAVESLRAGRDVPLPPAAAPASAPHLAIFQAKCAKCHDAPVATTKGKGFVLLNDGKVVNLTPVQLVAIADEVYSGHMPLGGKLSDEEVGTVMAWIGQARKQSPVGR